MAQYILGIIYYEGVLVQKNINKCLNLLLQSSNNGNILSHFFLGFIYQIENDVKKDNEKAIHYYKLASSLDLQFAKHNLAIIYKNKFDGNDDNNKKNIWFSIELFNEAIRQKNDILSMYNLAKLYIFKKPIEDSFDEAIKLLLVSCGRFKPSYELLAFALLLKFDFDGLKIENEIFNNTSYKNHSDSILKTIKDNNLYDNLAFMKKFALIREIDLIYDYKLGLDLVVVNENNENLNQINLVNITKEFYEGFGIEI